MNSEWTVTVSIATGNFEHTSISDFVIFEPIEGVTYTITN